MREGARARGREGRKEGGSEGGREIDTLVGSSLPLVVRARMATNPAKQRGVMAASVPPVTHTSAMPFWRKKKASPMVCVPEAQAETEQ